MIAAGSSQPAETAATSGSATAASTTDIGTPAPQAKAAAAESKPKRKRCSVKNCLKAHPSAKRLQKELIQIMDEPPPNCSASIAGNSLSEWSATISGPEGTPYEGGIFHLKVDFPMDYPFSPPKVTFKTKIYHCNISPGGNICLDILKEKWSVVLTIRTVLLSITSLLDDCNPADPLVCEIAQMYCKHRSEHDRIAAQWTEKYARE